MEKYVKTMDKSDPAMNQNTPNFDAEKMLPINPNDPPNAVLTKLIVIATIEHVQMLE